MGIDEKRPLGVEGRKSVYNHSAGHDQEQQLGHGAMVRRQGKERLNHSAALSVRSAFSAASISAAFASTNFTMWSIMSPSLTWWSVTPER